MAEEDDYPRTKDGYALSGLCEQCGEPIYRFSDHGDCLYGAMDE